MLISSKWKNMGLYGSNCEELSFVFQLEHEINKEAAACFNMKEMFSHYNINLIANYSQQSKQKQGLRTLMSKHLKLKN